FSTNSGLPVNRLRSTGFCVATPTGQVARWHTRIMMPPETTSGAVANPNSSAPSSAATITSRPDFICPSPGTTMLSRTQLSLSDPEQRGDDHVAPGLHLPVDLHDDAVAQTVEHQRLLGLGQADLPGRTRVLERGQRRRAGTPVVAGDEHDVGVRLRHTRRDRA